ncbi:MAG: hypothetical protein R2932_14045 [Caldilineaceae bacterium]
MVSLSPALLLGACFNIAYAALAHLGTGRSLRDLLVFLVMGSIGFSFGQLIGTMTQTSFLQIGELHLFEATLGAWLLLVVTYMIERR